MRGGTTVDERGAGSASAQAAVGDGVRGVRFSAGARLVRRRRPLPSTRAVVGGFLVAVAAVGTFALATQSHDDRLTGFVVARGDLVVGQRVEADDLAVARLDVPPFLGARAFGSAGDVVGAVVVAPVARGELVQRSAVLRDVPPGRQVSFPVEAARAVDGSLHPGESVDVLVTYGTGASATTAVVARDARVVRVRRPDGTLSDGRSLVVTVGVQNDDEAAALAHASGAGTVTLVRVGGAR